MATRAEKWTGKGRVPWHIHRDATRQAPEIRRYAERFGHHRAADRFGYGVATIKKVIERDEQRREIARTNPIAVTRLGSGITDGSLFKQLCQELANTLYEAKARALKWQARFEEAVEEKDKVIAQLKVKLEQRDGQGDEEAMLDLLEEIKEGA